MEGHTPNKREIRERRSLWARLLLPTFLTIAIGSVYVANSGLRAHEHTRHADRRMVALKLHQAPVSPSSRPEAAPGALKTVRVPFQSLRPGMRPIVIDRGEIQARAKRA